MRGRRRVVARIVLPLAFLVAAACGTTDGEGGAPTVGAPNPSPTGDASPTDTESTVDVVLKDFAIGLGGTTAVDAGEVTFRIRNEGPSEHEFVIVETAEGVGSGDLPTQDGVVNEDGLEIVDEAEGIGAGDEEDLTVDLEPGAYILLCNIAGHYGAGMHTELTVR